MSNIGKPVRETERPDTKPVETPEPVEVPSEPLVPA